MKITKASCLVIGDGITGMQNQSIALAKSLGLQPTILEVKPFWLTRYIPILFAGRFNLPLSNKDVLLLSINSDILMVLDDCPKLTNDKNLLKKSLDTSLYWAKRCKIEFGNNKRKALFGIIQGGIYKDLRLESLEGLKEIEFDELKV